MQTRGRVFLGREILKVIIIVGVMMVLTGVRRQDAGRRVRDVTPGKQKIKSHEIFRNTAHQIIYISSPY